MSNIQSLNKCIHDAGSNNSLQYLHQQDLSYLGLSHDSDLKKSNMEEFFVFKECQKYKIRRWSGEMYQDDNIWQCHAVQIQIASRDLQWICLHVHIGRIQ